MTAKKYAAEAIGTFWLTFAGCGSAVIAAGFPQVGIGLLGVSLAFGLTVVTMAYAIGHISGCHLNPAVTVGLAAGGRFPAGQILPYVIAQVVGAIVAAARALSDRERRARLRRRQGFASNGYGEHSPGQYSLVACLVTEVVMTMMFLFIIMGATHGKAPAGFAPLAIGLGADADPPRQHPGHQHLGEPGAQHRPGAVRRRLGAGAALAVLGRAADRRRARRRALSLAQRGADRHRRRPRRRSGYLRAATCLQGRRHFGDMAHLAARPRGGLAVEMHGGARHRQPVARSSSTSSPIRLVISTRPWRIGLPSGQPAIARMCCSNCEIDAPSSVQWPELCTRGAISLTSTCGPCRPATTNISTASTPT